MDGGANGLILADEPDFVLAGLSVSPSACRIVGSGRDLRVEAKTMAVLVVLARAAGATVTREELIEACWDGRVVSDDAVTRTIAKVRSIARMVTPAPFTLETVPKVGYRLLGASSEIATTLAANGGALDLAPRAHASRIGERLSGRARQWLPGVAVIAALAAMPLLWGRVVRDDGDFSTAAPRSPEVMDALMNLDQPRLEAYLRRGWDVNWQLDSEGNSALHQVMMVCERATTHDRLALARVVRFLVESDADWTAQNGWGDTPLEIASARRYCGPRHPVVVYLNELAEHTPPQLIGVVHPPQEPAPN